MSEIRIHERFPRYTEFDPAVPVWCVTPDVDGCYHRFFDTSPISPSGRYVAVTRLRREDVMPVPGDACEIVVVDLREGETRVVAESRGFDTQLGAQVQWGADDTQLFFNDMDCEAWRPFGVVMNPTSERGAGPAPGERRELEGTVYMVSRDGTKAASSCLLRTGLTQAGYGVLAPVGHVPTNSGAPSDDGLYVTDVATGKQELLVSIQEIVETVLDPAEYADGDFYGFHVKWNPQGTRLMYVLRWVSRDGGKHKNPNAITMDADGSNIAICFPDTIWAKGGHHPDWAPDGETGTINLKLDGDTLSLVRAIPHDAVPRYATRRTAECKAAFVELERSLLGMGGYTLQAMTTVQGSGHPSLHINDKQMVTDVYLHEKLAYGDGTTPIRWIDVENDTEEVVVRINNDPPFTGPKRELRIDAHPAWSRDYGYVAFNGCDNGVRRVYVADMRSKIR